MFVGAYFFVVPFFSCPCIGDKDDENKVKMTKGQKQKILQIFSHFFHLDYDKTNPDANF